MGIVGGGRNCAGYSGAAAAGAGWSSAMVSASLDTLRRFFLRKEPLFLLGMVVPEVLIAAIYVSVALRVKLGPAEGDEWQRVQGLSG